MTDPQTKEKLLKFYKGMQEKAPIIWRMVAPRLMKKGKVEEKEKDFIEELEEEKQGL